MNTLAQNLIDSVRAAILETDPPLTENWNKILEFAQKHDLDNFLAEIAPKIESLSAEEREAMYNLQMTSIIKDANQESEVDDIIRLFDERGINAVMLKGWYLKKLYPRRDLRTMGDTDIFIKESDQSAVHDILLCCEYKCNSTENKKDIAYTKLPFQTLEIHKNLFMYEDKWNDCFNMPDSPMYIWNRLVKLDGYGHIYRMDDELFFVYMIAHTAKHLLDDGGIGIRAFIDIWIYLRNKPDLDFDIVNRDLDKLNLRKFAENSISLSAFWFDNKPAATEIKEFGDYIIKCGVYGNSDFFVVNNEVMRDGKQRGKWGYAWKRAFPGMESMKVRYPKLEKKPWLLPVCYSKRLLYSTTHRRNTIKREINSAGNIDYDQAHRIREMYKNIGLQE